MPLPAHNDLPYQLDVLEDIRRLRDVGIAESE